MYTFNLAVVFGKAELVYTIVCASDEPINKREVYVVATEHFKLAATYCHNTREVLEEVAIKIEEECGCQTVIVEANAAVMISRRKIQ